MRRRGPVIAAAAVLLVVALWRIVPFATQDRTIYASTPTVPPTIAVAEIDVRPDRELCVAGVTFEPDAEAVRVAVRTPAGGGGPLRVTAVAPGYRASAVVPARTTSGTLTIPLDRVADRERPGGRLCLENAGRRTVTVFGTADPRAFSASEITLDGETLTAEQPSVALVRRAPDSLLGTLGAVVDRAATFRPGGEALLWLLVLAVLATPVLLLAGLRRALGEDETPDPRP